MCSDGGPIAWAALLDWYVGASELVEDLEACRIIVGSLLVGSATSNLVACDELNALTRRAELWLLAHPCPEEWNAAHVGTIVQMCMEIGELIVGAGGDPTRVDQATLKDKSTEVDLMIDEVKELIFQLMAVLDD